MDAAIVTALLGLVGTLAVAVLGYRRWSKERQVGLRAPYDQERRALYIELWRKAEGVSVALRRTSMPPSEFTALLADLNEFMLTNGLHIDENHRIMVNDYMVAVHAFHSAVLEAGATAEIEYGTTQDIPPEISENLEKLGAAQAHAKSLKQALHNEIHPIASGSASAS